MPNDKWQTPDIEGMLQERQEQAESGASAPLGYHKFPFTGGHPSRGHDELELGEDQYIIDPDYMEPMGLSWEDLIKYKK